MTDIFMEMVVKKVRLYFRGMHIIIREEQRLKAADKCHDAIM